MSIGVFQAIIIVLVPTVPTFLVLHGAMRRLWLLLLTPLPAVVLVGAFIAMAKLLELQIGKPDLPHSDGWIGVFLLGAWLLAFLITAVMLAVAAAITRKPKTGPPAS